MSIPLNTPRNTGSLTFMVGATADDFPRAQSLLSLMGKKIVHCGPAGSGSSVKLCNNLALAMQMIAVSEALNLGSHLGIDPRVLTEVMNSSTAACWSSTVNNPVPGTHQPPPKLSPKPHLTLAQSLTLTLTLTLALAPTLTKPSPSLNPNPHLTLALTHLPLGNTNKPQPSLPYQGLLLTRLPVETTLVALFPPSWSKI